MVQGLLSFHKDGKNYRLAFQYERIMTRKSGPFRCSTLGNGLLSSSGLTIDRIDRASLALPDSIPVDHRAFLEELWASLFSETVLHSVTCDGHKLDKDEWPFKVSFHSSPLDSHCCLWMSTDARNQPIDFSI